MSKFWKYFSAGRKDRPLWFIDAKWVVGILFVLVFSSTLALYNVMQLTDRERAVEVITVAIEKSLSKAEGNIQNLIAEYKNELAAKAEQESPAEPTEERPIAKILKSFFPESEILTSSPEQLKTKMLQDIAVPFYEGGTSAIFTMLRGVDYTKYLDEGLQSFQIYSDETHQQMQTWFGISLTVSLVVLLGLIYFSCGWGKLFSPGLVLLIASFPGFASYNIAHQFVTEFLPSIVTEGANLFMDIFIVAVIQTVERNIGEISAFHTTFFYIGLSLMIAAAGGKIYFVVKKRRAQNQSPTPPPKQTPMVSQK